LHHLVVELGIEDIAMLFDSLALGNVEIDADATPATHRTSSTPICSYRTHASS
jgi:hypothetical protein